MLKWMATKKYVVRPRPCPLDWAVFVYFGFYNLHLMAIKNYKKNNEIYEGSAWSLTLSLFFLVLPRVQRKAAEKRKKRKRTQVDLAKKIFAYFKWIMQESISNGDQMPPPTPANDLNTIKSKSSREVVRSQDKWKELFKFQQIACRHYAILYNKPKCRQSISWSRTHLCRLLSLN